MAAGMQATPVMRTVVTCALEVPLARLRVLAGELAVVPGGAVPPAVAASARPGIPVTAHAINPTSTAVTNLNLLWAVVLSTKYPFALERLCNGSAAADLSLYVTANRPAIQKLRLPGRPPAALSPSGNPRPTAPEEGGSTADPGV